MLSNAVSRDQIMQLLSNAVSRNQLLGHSGIQRLFGRGSFIASSGLRSRRLAGDDDEDDSSDETDSQPATGYDPVGPRARRKRPRGKAAFQKVPSDEGKELMNTGTFGSNHRSLDSIKRRKRLAYNVMQRELGLGGNGRQKNANRVLRQDMLPESVADTIIHYNARCYSGQFSDDGNFFFSCAQDFRVRMYDTSNPYDWKYYKVGAYDTTM
jgi:WD repeat-containing protein 23